jgi:GT2 family glycosyltransferase
MDPTPAEHAGPPRVTALIVSRNCSAQLRACLQALERSANRERLEVLVVDRGSADGTADVAEDFPEVQTLRLPKDFGRTKATNIGMRTAKGELVLFLPAHVELEPDTIDRLALRLESYDVVGAVCPKVDRWYRLPDIPALAVACGKHGELPNPQPIPPEAVELAIDYAPGAPLLVRRAFVRGMNYFDERYGDHWSDLELCWQLRNASKTIVALQNVPIRYGELPPREEDAVHRADCILGASTYIAKHFGAAAGANFRFSRTIGALATARFSVFSALLSGQKVDGTHI